MEPRRKPFLLLLHRHVGQIEFLGDLVLDCDLLSSRAEKLDWTDLDCGGVLLGVLCHWFSFTWPA